MQVEAPGNGTTARAHRRSIAAWAVTAASIALMSMSFVIKVAFGSVFGAESAPGAGTTVTGRVPAHERPAGEEGSS